MFRAFLWYKIWLIDYPKYDFWRESESNGGYARKKRAFYIFIYGVRSEGQRTKSHKI